MFNKSCFVLLFTAFILDINGAKIDYTFNDLANGWLKFHSIAASWSDASTICDVEDGVLASPATSQLRDAIKHYVSRVDHSVTTIHTGVQAVYENGDFASVDGIPLSKMPVYLEEGAPIFESSESCVAWTKHNDSIHLVDCKDNLPFVCYKKRNTMQIIGCNTLDREYRYEPRSGSCYKFHHKRQNWMKAYKRCRSEGAYLAIINSQLESQVLKKIYERNPQSNSGMKHEFFGGIFERNPQSYSEMKHVFLGARDWLDGDSWKTVKNTNLEDAGFNTWASGEPNNIRGKENCISMFENGTLNDENCEKNLSFICEKDPEILVK